MKYQIHMVITLCAEWKLSCIAVGINRFLVPVVPPPLLSEDKNCTSLLPGTVQVTHLGSEEWEWLKMTRRHVECYSSKGCTSLSIKTSRSTGEPGQGSDSAPLQPPSRPPKCTPTTATSTPLTTRPSDYTTTPPAPHSHTNTHTGAHTRSEGLIKALICKWEPQ